MALSSSYMPADVSEHVLETTAGGVLREPYLSQRGGDQT